MFKHLGVVGLGTMGSSIAEVFAYNKFDVTIIEQNEELLNKGMRNIENILSSNLKYGRSRASKEISRIESLGIQLLPDQKRV